MNIGNVASIGMNQLILQPLGNMILKNLQGQRD